MSRKFSRTNSCRRPPSAYACRYSGASNGCGRPRQPASGRENRFDNRGSARRCPPSAPPMTGFPFHKASVTVSPNPSFSDFCSTIDRRSLQGVDLAMRVRRQQQHVQVGIVAGTLHDLGQHFGSLGIVIGRATDQHQLQLRMRRLHQAISVDHAHRILESIETRDLQEHRSLGIDSQPLEDRDAFGIVHRRILIRQADRSTAESGTSAD